MAAQSPNDYAAPVHCTQTLEAGRAPGTALPDAIPSGAAWRLNEM
jgi:hypothetical protein